MSARIRTGTSAYAYTLVPNEKWLKDESRAYPVIIDPDIQPSFSGTVDDTYISYQSQNSNYNARDRLKIGGTPHYRTLIKVSGLPTLETGDVIVESTLNLSRYNTSSAYNKEVDLYKVLKTWDFDTVTWSNFQPDSATSVERGHISAVAATAQQNKFNQFDITALVKYWYENPTQNFGVMLESWKESSNWYTEYRSSNYNSTYSGHPYFSIIYVNSIGLEDRFTYHSQSAGRAGTGSVNDFSGNLTWAHADASISNGVLPISLSHVYNTNDRLTDIGYGYGWRLNYSQSLKKVELTNRTETTTYYQLTDGDGTRHYYKYSSTNTYVNELDKNSTLTISGTTATVSDKGGNKLIFSCDANVNNGRLTTVEDANGNQTIITYLSTSITDLITGTCEYQKYIYQTITVAGKKGDAYSFGAWLRSDSVPLTTQPNGSSTRLYGIKRVSIEFLNGSTTVNSSLVYFNADTDEWQFACGSAVASGAYTSIRISLNFHYTRNDCYYDGVQLYKEEFSQAYTYDASGNLTGYTSLIGQQNSFQYDNDNNVTGSTDPRGNTTTYTYDTNHNLLTATSPQGVVTTNTYDKGQVTETTVGNSSTYIRSTASYDAATGLTNSVTDARGNSVAYRYDSTTRQNTTVTDPKNNTSTYTYGDASNMLRLTSLQGAGTGSVSYGYDSYGKLTSITHGSTVYGLTYDIWNRSAQTKVGNTALSTNAYDSYGRLSSVTYANGFTAQYTYDELDRVTEIHLNNTLTYAFIYNAEGNLYEQRNYRTGRSTFFDYDHAGRCMASLEKSFTGSGSSISYGAVVSSYKYEYDVNNNLTKLSNTTVGQSWNTIYTYDGDNRPLTATFGNGKVMTNTYDAIGRITQRRLGLNSNYDTALTYKAGVNNSQTALLATYQNGGDTPYSYEYDANGNITEITQGNISVTYSYNAANELIRENNGFTNQTVTYAYDNWGNLTEKNVYAYTTGDLPATPTQTTPYAYTNSSWGDQLTSYNNQSILYDAMGNPTSYLGQTLTWRGKQLTGAGTTTYEYDENGLRLNKTVNNVSTDYYYNGSVLMSLVTGNDTLLFSYDASGQVTAVNYNGTYYYYLRNGQGDIVKLIDNSGATVVEYSYDTWGKQLSCTGSLASTLGTLNPFRYRGYVYDEETGFYYLQSRYYDPTTCRFISADILLSTGQGVLGHNCYAYCLGNPVGLVDYGGYAPWSWLLYWGEVHRYVQEEISAIYNYSMEEGFDGGALRIDLIGESIIWEVKSAGPAAMFASAQLARYLKYLNRDTEKYKLGRGIISPRGFTRTSQKNGATLYIYYWEDPDQKGVIKYVFGADEADVYKQLDKIGVAYTSIVFADSLSKSIKPSPGTAKAAAAAFLAYGLGCGLRGGWTRMRDSNIVMQFH